MRVRDGTGDPLKVRDSIAVDSNIVGCLDEGDTAEVHEIKEHAEGGARFVRARISSLVAASGKHLRGWTTVKFQGQPLKVFPSFPTRRRGSCSDTAETNGVAEGRPDAAEHESSALLFELLDLKLRRPKAEERFFFSLPVQNSWVFWTLSHDHGFSKAVP